MTLRCRRQQNYDDGQQRGGEVQGSDAAQDYDSDAEWLGETSVELLAGPSGNQWLGHALYRPRVGHLRNRRNQVFQKISSGRTCSPAQVSQPRGTARV
jgi:hypothetical protein